MESGITEVGWRGCFVQNDNNMTSQSFLHDGQDYRTN